MAGAVLGLCAVLLWAWGRGVARAIRRPCVARAIRRPRVARAIRRPRVARAIRRPRVARAIMRTTADQRWTTPQLGARLRELREMPYRDYLRTSEWRKTRAAALARAGHRCSLDATHTDGLEVHHNSYERLGAELASDLIVLCHTCHRRHHFPSARV